METSKSLELIENMFLESKKTLHKNSFYFILWGIILCITGIAEYAFRNQDNNWMVWPLVTTIGGLLSGYYGMKEGKKTRTITLGDRIIMAIWMGFMFSLVFVITYSIFNQFTPHALVLMFTSYATFLTGAVSKFKPLMFGSLALLIAAILAGFVLPKSTHSLIFAAAMLFGYVLPGIALRKSENA